MILKLSKLELDEGVVEIFKSTIGNDKEFIKLFPDVKSSNRSYLSATQSHECISSLCNIFRLSWLTKPDTSGEADRMTAQAAYLFTQLLLGDCVIKMRELAKVKSAPVTFLVNHHHGVMQNLNKLDGVFGRLSEDTIFKQLSETAMRGVKLRTFVDFFGMGAIFVLVKQLTDAL